jgi:hypothetical protein
MHLSNPDSALGLPGSGHERLEQAAEHRTHVVAAIEAELHLGQVSVAVLRELPPPVISRSWTAPMEAATVKHPSPSDTTVSGNPVLVAMKVLTASWVKGRAARQARWGRPSSVV